MFQNKTNGITPRRPLRFCSPELSDIITKWLETIIQLLLSVLKHSSDQDLNGIELQQRPLANYMELVQRDIDQDMRRILVDWLVENPTLQHYTRYEVAELKNAALAMEDLLLNTSGSTLAATREKYNQPKFKSVAKLTSPKRVTSLFSR